MRKYADVYAGKIRDIQETELEFANFASIFDPKIYWVDITGLDYKIGDVAVTKDGVGVVFVSPETLIEEVEIPKVDIPEKIEKKSIEEIRFALMGNVIQICNDKFEKVFTDYLTPEVLTYETQKDEAINYLEDAMANVPLLTAIANANNTTVKETAIKVLRKENIVTKTANEILLYRAKLEDKINNTDNIEELESLLYGGGEE